MSTLDALVDKGLVARDWAEALAPVEEQIAAMGRFLRDELAAGRDYLPAGEQVLRAFSRPLSLVKVLIVGQDPYPTPGHAVGLSFSVAPGVAPPKSLANIYRELVTDLGVPPPTTGDLTPWADHGVMLLNRCLTVTPGQSASHRGRGWEAVTDQAIRTLASRSQAGTPLTAIRRRCGPLSDPLGARRPIAEARPGAYPLGRVGPPQPALGLSRLLRVPTVQPGERHAGRAGRTAGGLAAPVVSAYS